MWNCTRATVYLYQTGTGETALENTEAGKFKIASISLVRLVVFLLVQACRLTVAAGLAVAGRPNPRLDLTLTLDLSLT